MTDMCKNVIPQEFYQQISKNTESFTVDELFSFILKLPVVYSTNDTKIICSGLQLDKTLE